MAEVKVIKLNENIFATNENTADETRKMLADKGIFFLNVMSSPGSGKTTMLSKLINMMKDTVRIGEMDVDIQSTIDAQRVADATGVRSLQIHNSGLCHIDAEMTKDAIQEFGVDDLDLLILENIGNLVCPAEFDTGAHKNVMLLSVPEGDDKPLKYPLMFSKCDVILINKMDTIAYFDFDLELATEHILKLNPNALIIPISSKTGEGMDKFVAWIQEEREKIKMHK